MAFVLALVAVYVTVGFVCGFMFLVQNDPYVRKGVWRKVYFYLACAMLWPVIVKISKVKASR